MEGFFFFDFLKFLFSALFQFGFSLVILFIVKFYFHIFNCLHYLIQLFVFHELPESVYSYPL